MPVIQASYTVRTRCFTLTKIPMRLAPRNTFSKLIGAFGILSLVIVLIAAVAVWRMHAADVITSNLVDDKLAKQQLTSELLGIARLNGSPAVSIAGSDSLELSDYFGEQLAGFAFTQNGWVQSYGSRCVKPPVIVGDVSRPHAMTVEWTTYAQSLTTRYMKGMLTGPVTILCWSFVRDDIAREQVALQLALAVRDEVCDLERAGIRIIQIDLP